MITLSFVGFLRLAHSVNASISISRISHYHVLLVFSIKDLVFNYTVSISYAKKWFPLIMGENLYRSSLLYKL